MRMLNSPQPSDVAAVGPRFAEELPEAGFSISLPGNLAGAYAAEKGSNSVRSTVSLNGSPADFVAEIDALGERFNLVRQRIGAVIFGQHEVIEQALITLLSGGHALLICVPDLAKTRLVETLGTILGLDDN